LIKIGRELDFEAEPPYEHLRSLFKEIMVQKKYEFDGIFDWFLDKNERKNALAAESSHGASARKRREPVA